MIKWIRTSRLPIKNSLSLMGEHQTCDLLVASRRKVAKRRLESKISIVSPPWNLRATLSEVVHLLKLLQDFRRLYERAS
jgi:hypothetical protein